MSNCLKRIPIHAHKRPREPFLQVFLNGQVWVMILAAFAFAFASPAQKKHRRVKKRKSSIHNFCFSSAVNRHEWHVWSAPNTRARNWLSKLPHRLIREIRKRARSDLLKYRRTLNLVRSGTQSLIRIKSVPIQFRLNLDVKEWFFRVCLLLAIFWMWKCGSRFKTISA